ncbi:MAG: hypothetical protein FJW39_23925 [Acidobacteria bacterium]|nr:hypothetical protein [Acidobacteriota bacterium]
MIGSQAILGQFPEAPGELRVSREADVFPLHHPERWDLIDGAIGEGSPFEASFGYYAHGVGPETAVLPGGWRDRLVLVSNENTLGTRGWCLEVHDLAVSKHAAGRGKDIEFTAALVRHGMTSHDVLDQRLDQTPLDPQLRSRIRQRIERQYGSVPGRGGPI